MTTSGLAVSLRKRLPADRATVFQALTEPDRMSRWFSPSDEIPVEILEQDLREGGTYKLSYQVAEDRKSVVCGRYLRIEPPARLIFTWTWEAPDPHAGIETVVSFELLEVDDATDLTVLHERFPDEETRKRHDEGWSGTLDRLAQFLGDAW